MAQIIDLSKYADTDVIIDVGSLSLDIGKYVEYEMRGGIPFWVFVSHTGYGMKLNIKTESNLKDDEFYVKNNAKLTCGFIKNYQATRYAQSQLYLLNDREKAGAYWEKPTGRGDYEFRTINYIGNEINFNASSLLQISYYPLGTTLQIECRLSGRKHLIDVDKNSDYAILDFYNARGIKNRYITDKNDPEAFLNTVIVKPNAALDFEFFKALPTIERIQSFLLEHRDWAEQIPGFAERLH